MIEVKKWLLLFVLSTLLVVVAACGGDEGTTEDSGQLNILTSFSILADLTERVTGDLATVDYIVPLGEEPHEYEPVPSDFQKASDTSIFFVNGLGLEEWLVRLVDNAGGVEPVSVSNGIEEVIPVGNSDEDDPHAWLDVNNVIQYVENIRDELMTLDPDNSEQYEANAEAYINELTELDEWIQAEVAEIPADKKTIVVSENAYQYFGAAYGFETIGIWELNSSEEGTPGQISRVVDIIRDQGIPAVFVETTVDERYMQTVAENAEVEIAGSVYTDAVGTEGSGAETYIDMMKHNVNTFVDGLKQ
ncbi:metal ABC transporter solute-binding protein, Zn/Mn family [Bacillus sp. FJAT-45037]|uniref:metal ABC transporter solute-binding protein, Zn/Mn family n=1 Tax=Bacillus sp. FJAT-45037 TaxID=2011007 RepID=UPI000C233CD2|nr:zinc ABC transporter substrate-binding protein [Bacillus sp. FJAT-45037]